MKSVLLGHGSGGRLTHELIGDLILKKLQNPILQRLEDSAIFSFNGIRLAFTTDSYVVKPIFFPGGDIGKLAVCGTINDLAVSGAVPRYISCGLILEEGFSMENLGKILDSMAKVAAEAGVEVVTGDTKVVERGKADGIFINTSGVGFIPEGIRLGMEEIRAGDLILINGPIGDHGIAVLSMREGIQFEAEIVSDCAPLNGLIARLISEVGDGIRFMRDPTRGGLATTLKEIAEGTGLGVEADETAIPINEAVRAACEILGLDPMFVANEGKVVLVIEPESAPKALQIMREHPLGAGSAAIGKITADHPGQVHLKTEIGSKRMIDMLVGEQLPRIC
ncbi:TPA: hydrogenase expression/formation protein HypE [Candidatus Poribacteria bacterium]|nr:hydrogenase expression/formation protein HypE [Candidatus Poribacteria bacterium]HEX29612.1 hydrogenase expression/formation protein HypE [Candidatus Poribacteria bacterium]